MKPDGYQIFRAAQLITPNIAYLLPRNVNARQLLELAAPADSECEMERNVLNGCVKTVTVYYGQLVRSASETKVSYVKRL